MTWRALTLGDCVTLQSGGTPSKSNASYWSGHVPWVSAKDMTSLRLQDTEDHVSVEAIGKGTRMIPKGTLLAVVRGMSLAKEFRIVEVQRPMTFNQDVKAIMPRDGIDSRFILYSLLARREHLLGIADEAAHGTKRLQTDRLLAVPISLPNLPAQRRIASILSAYDDLIENNTRRIAILEEMAKRIYEEWFVHFRFPGHEQVKMVESELGLIPEGWFPTPVGGCVTVHRGKSYKSVELADEGGLPFVNLKCMERDGGFRKSGLKRFIGAFKETQKVTTGDLVMAVTDMTQERRIVARCGRVPRLGADFGVISMDLVKIEANKGVPKDFIYGMLRWSGFADEVKQHANGANVLHLSPDRITEYRFARPPSNISAQFAELISPMLHQSDVLTEKNEVLRTTRDLLLPKLISGELDVLALPEPEEAVAT